MIAEIEEVADVRLWPSHEPPTTEQFVGLVRDAVGILSVSGDPLGAAVVERLPRLRVVSQSAAGTDNIGLAALTARGIPVGHTPGVVTDATADITWALILAVARYVTESDAYVRRGGWDYRRWDIFWGVDLAGATLGIVGFGQIGRAVAQRAVGFGMKVVYHSRSPVADPIGDQLPLEELLRSADVVSLHVPLTDQTKGLIGRRELRLMKESAILVNTARGGIVHQDALVEALREGWIWGCGIDSPAVEPMPADDPLLALRRCVVLPHIGTATQRSRHRMSRMAVDNLLAGLSGRRLLHCANPDVYGTA
jgi:glyoxylate reductase